LTIMFEMLYALHENAAKCPDIFIIRCARAGHWGVFRKR